MQSTRPVASGRDNLKSVLSGPPIEWPVQLDDKHRKIADEPQGRRLLSSPGISDLSANTPQMRRRITPE